MSHQRRYDDSPLTDSERRTVIVHRNIQRWILGVVLAGGGAVAADKTGVLDQLVSKASAEDIDRALEQNAKFRTIVVQTRNNDRMLRWLVEQEIRRQERENRIAVPPVLE